MNKEDFIIELEKINIKLNEKQLMQLDRYYQLLIEWNEKINLTRITEEKEVYLKHFYDSLTLSKVIDLTKDIKLCDIGTGAGFPGMVLKIIFPNLQVTLIDSLLKRVKFLNIIIQELELTGIEAIHSRAEDYAKLHRNEFDIVTSRAVSRLNNLLDYSATLVKNNGYFIPIKAKCEDEIKECNEKLKRKKLFIEKIAEFNLPFENSHRTLIKIKKCQ